MGEEKAREQGVSKMTAMNEWWMNLFGGLLGIVFGSVGIIFHKRLGQKAMEFQKNVFHTRVSETAIRGTKIGYLIIGIVFVVCGVLYLLRLRP
jgi:uncharacterized membrane protein YdcZ (DUF606 family)